MTDTPQTSCRPLLPALLVAACATALALIILGLQPLRTPLYWWHVAIGDAIYTWERIPDQQLFLFTVKANEGWVYTSWLGSVITALFHEVGGAELGLLVRNAMGALSVGLVAYFAARRSDDITAIAIPALIATGLVFLFAEPAPATLVLPFATVLLAAGFLLFEHPEKFWPALFFPAVVLAVINIDFASAAVCIFVALVVTTELLRRARTSDARKPMVIGAVISALALPSLFGFAYGPTYWTESFAVAFAAPETFVSASVIAPAIVVALLVALLARSDDAHLPAPWPVLAVLVVGTGLFALAAPATIPIFAIASAMVLVAPLSHLLDGKSPKRPGTPALIVALLLLTAGAVVLQPGVDTRAPILTAVHDDVRTTPPAAGTLTDDLPLRCAEELNRTGRTLRVFHDGEHAGFLLYHLLSTERPHPLLFDYHRELIDGETADLAELLRTDRAARGHFQQRGINAAVVDRHSYPALVDELDEAPEWHEFIPDADSPTACFYLGRVSE